MLSAWIALMLNGLFFTLRLSGNTGSFPRPLKTEEERRYLELARQGDVEARNILVEHNLRLVAHIVKKCYPERRENMALQRTAHLPGLCEEGDYPLERSN